MVRSGIRKALNFQRARLGDCRTCARIKNHLFISTVVGCFARKVEIRVFRLSLCTIMIYSLPWPCLVGI